jgi:spore coat protein U-like protein
MRPPASLLIASVLCFASVASAAPIDYQVSVDTSSLAGTAGSLDFNFNPGPLVSQAASLQISGFASDGTLAGSPTLTGDVSGALPGTLTFDNGTGFNDYFEGFTFGKSLRFDVSLYGPALSSPDGTSTSGSAFAFSLFSDAAGTKPALTTDTAEGFALTVAVNLDGTTRVSNFSAQTAVSAVSPVPEPGGLALLGAVLAWFGARHFRALVGI